MTSYNSLGERWGGPMWGVIMGVQQRKYRRDLGVYMPQFCDQWDVGCQKKKELLLISWHFIHSKKVEGVAFITYLKETKIFMILNYLK